MNLDPWLVRLIVGVIVITWLGLTVASTVFPNVQVPASLNGLFMTVAGGVVAMQAKGSKSKSSDDDKGGDE